MQRGLTRIIISASVHEECGIDPTLRIELYFRGNERAKLGQLKQLILQGAHSLR